MNYLEIQPNKVESTVNDLNMLLSNYQLYYQNLRNFHWNISGKHFFDLHDKFEEMYNDAKVNIDEIAERILTLGMKPFSTLSKYIDSATISETTTEDPEKMVIHILGNHKIIISNLRKAIQTASNSDDEGTVDMLSSFLYSIEKKSWMFRAWLDK